MHNATIVKEHKYNSSARAISLLERIFSFQLKQQLKSQKLDLSVEEFRTLFYLWFENGLTQNEIAKIAFKEKSLVSKTINSLEKKGLIVRIRVEDDKRIKRIHLTQKAIEIKKQALDCANKITTDAEKNIAKEDLDIFFNVLISMRNNLT